jgi:anaerobic ribonucleoside-triphosphate reductase
MIRSHVEDIQDSVEIVLIQAGYVGVAKSYMDYRAKHAQLREIKKTELDYAAVVDNYLHVNDWRVKENSTVTYSVGGLILSNSGAVTANYWLSQVYDKEIADAHRNADMHIHDLSMLTGYCAGWSLKQLIQEGLRRSPWQNHFVSSPPLDDPLQPDGQLPWHHAERMGRRSSLQWLRHLSRSVRQSR